MEVRARVSGSSASPGLSPRTIERKKKEFSGSSRKFKELWHSESATVRNYPTT
jgi:hypothetical protein